MLTAALAVGCARSAPPAAPSPHRVEYRLAWIGDDGARADDGAWSVTNDLGVRVRVTRGWITSHSMELVECPKEPAATPYGVALELLGGAVAWAGHATGTPNPAAIRPMQVESLTEPADVEAGVVTLAPQAYCRLHYLVARAATDASGLPTAVDMVDATVHVEGAYRAPETATDVPFTVHSDVAYGQLFERVVGDAPLRVDTGTESVRVELRRRRSRLFDGVDFARMSERQAALRMLTSFVDATTVVVAPLTPDDAPAR